MPHDSRRRPITTSVAYSAGSAIDGASSRRVASSTSSSGYSAASRSIPPAARRAAAQSSMTVRKTGSSSYSWRPMPAYCAPPPGIMNTTDGSSPRWCWASMGLVGASRRSAASLRRGRNHRSAHRERLRGRRGACTPRRRGRDRGGPAGERRGLRPRPRAASAVRPDTVISWAARDGLEASLGGASSTMRCALVPPAPRPVIPAMRVPPGPGSHGRSSAFTKNGLFGKSACGFGSSKWRLGGISRFCSESTVLISDADAGGFAGVADVRLERTDRAELPVVGAEPVRLRQPGDLDRVTDERAGAVGLDVGHVAGVDVGDRQRLGDHLRLAAERSARDSRPWPGRRC